jgi:hypothetical protein
MSVSIHWRPATDSGKTFSSGTSDQLEKLQKVFGNGLSQEDITVLRAMAVAASTTFYDEVADIVENVGAIEIWGEW